MTSAKGKDVCHFRVGPFFGSIIGIDLSAEHLHELDGRVPGWRRIASQDVTPKALQTRGVHVGSTWHPLSPSNNPRVLRRAINAALTGEALCHNAVLLHGVVVARGQTAVLILGDYNAGKTRLNQALRQHGFITLAGDLVLISATDGHVVAGTRAVLSKWSKDITGRALPRSPLSAGDGEARWLAETCAGGPYADIRVTATMILGDRPTARAQPEEAEHALFGAFERSYLRALARERWPTDAESGVRSLVQGLSQRVPSFWLQSVFPDCVPQTLELIDVVTGQT